MQLKGIGKLTVLHTFAFLGDKGYLRRSLTMLSPGLVYVVGNPYRQDSALGERIFGSCQLYY